jgi:hypothetical protein
MSQVGTVQVSLDGNTALENSSPVGLSRVDSQERASILIDSQREATVKGQVTVRPGIVRWSQHVYVGYGVPQCDVWWPVCEAKLEPSGRFE